MIKQTLRNPALRKRATQFGRLVRRSAVTPRRGQTHKPHLVSNGELGVTFIGHASFFLQIGGQSVVIDPNFARWLFVLKRLRRPGVRIADLPAIDLVLVSHAHFDHLHRPSLRAIVQNNLRCGQRSTGNHHPDACFRSHLRSGILRDHRTRLVEDFPPK